MRSREEQINDLAVAMMDEGGKKEASYAFAQETIDAAIQRGRELERAEMGQKLRSTLDTHIATYLRDGTNPDMPAWVWFGDCDRQEVSLGRWNKYPGQALYIRSDLIRDAMNAENGQ